MLKNMSFGKMVGIFVAFLVLMVIGAVFIMKMTMQNAAAPGQQVTTKTYAPRNTQTAQSAQQGQSAPAQAQPVFDPAPNPAPNAAYPANNVAVVPAGTNQPQVTSPGTFPGPVAVAPGGQQVVTNIPVDLGGRLSNIDTTLASLDARVSALEGKRADAVNRKTAAARPASKARPLKAAAAKEKSLNELPGYKSMAVVSNRAWVSAPDGTEDSVVEGELVPRVRVRTMNPETGVVITSTNQRIDPRAR